MIRINDILDRIQDYNPAADLGLIELAYIFSAKVHEGQMRLSGEPYLSHPLEVAGILTEMKLDAVSVAAGLLHDVVEDTHASEEEIEKIFGTEVMQIVSGVTKLSALSFSSSLERKAENIRKMLLAMAEDIRVILIKLADRVHNMRTLQYHSSEQKRRKIAKETIDIYAPIAARLGIYRVKNELENIAFEYLLPDQFERLKQLVAKDRQERENYIETVKDFIKLKMDEKHLPSDVMGRYKRYYSIYQKMLRQKLTFEEVYDIIAFRIILDTKKQCYKAMGLMHAVWKPIPGKFKDYIGMPKSNKYQSLHTTVIGPYGERIEIQIRTKKMDKVAESGIAAHWSYKEGKTADTRIVKQLAWVKQMVENQADTSNPDEFLENVRIDLFPDEVYVFTPLGDIKSFPKGATPVDFAYSIHSEVGHQCVGAKVDGRIVPLKYQLQTGESVEVITRKGHQPSKDWLGFVKTVRARSRIRQWISTQEKERSRRMGREMCEKAFRKHKLDFNTFIKSPEMEKVVQEFGYKSADNLIIAVGYGKVTTNRIMRSIDPQSEEDLDLTAILTKAAAAQKKGPGSGIVVKGEEGVLVRFGKCCQPLPGDPIIGFITRSFGVTVHRTGCTNLVKTNPERLIEVQWDQATAEFYPVKIMIQALDRKGLLADMASSISKAGANIMSVNSDTDDDNLVSSYFTLSVKSLEQLEQVLVGLKQVRQVQAVDRMH